MRWASSVADFLTKDKIALIIESLEAPVDIRDQEKRVFRDEKVK